ncbi:CBS domain-containing protein [Mesorhizobium sp.]|uniref:CBS domain-containing protein n=1 Tax=Mesorhizobium sp. TaxID=1871066 RepID=UPI0025BBD5BD|nr:CBS domain-containing protein [Mesorhizobium sp.]
MTSPVVAVGPDSTLDEVCDLLVARDMSAVAVIDQGVLLGMVSEEDLIHRVEIGTAAPRRSWWGRLFGNNAALAADYLKSHSVHVTDVMTRQVVTVSLSTPIDEIAALLEVDRARRVFVVVGGQVVGIVGPADLVRALASVRKNLPRPVSFHDDASIRQEIVGALRSEAWPSIGEADVIVTNGVVTLWGGYLSEQERKASLVLAENTAGVRAVDDHRVPLDISYAMV